MIELRELKEEWDRREKELIKTFLSACQFVLLGLFILGNSYLFNGAVPSRFVSTIILNPIFLLVSGIVTVPFIIYSIHSVRPEIASANNLPSLQDIFKFSLLSALLLSYCVSTLICIFGGVPFLGISSISVNMIMAACTGLFSLIMAKELIKKTNAAGAYAQWAAFFGMCIVISGTTLLAFSLGGIDIGSFLLRISSLIFMITSLLFIASVGLVFLNATGRMQRHRNLNRYASQLLYLLKIVLMMGFLFLAFLSLAMAFNFPDLGLLTYLGDLSFRVIVETGMADTPASIVSLGMQWINAFFVGIFATSTFIAFELAKSVLRENDRTILSSVARVLIKLIFTTGLIISLMVVSSPFHNANSSMLSMLGVFLLATLLPFFTKNIELPYFERVNNVFNTYFGVSPFHGERQLWKYVGREFFIASIFLGSFAAIIFTPAVFPLRIQAIIVAVVTVGFAVVQRVKTVRVAYARHSWEGPGRRMMDDIVVAQEALQPMVHPQPALTVHGAPLQPAQSLVNNNVPNDNTEIELVPLGNNDSKSTFVENKNENNNTTQKRTLLRFLGGNASPDLLNDYSNNDNRDDPYEPLLHSNDEATHLEDDDENNNSETQPFLLSHVSSA